LIDKDLISEIRDCENLAELYALLGAVEKQVKIVEEPNPPPAREEASKK